VSGLTQTGKHLYASELYARALSHIGRAVPAPAWSSFVLARPLPGGDGEDAIGAYPLAVIDPAADIEAGLSALAETGLVSVVLVPDPLAGPGADRLSAAFSLCRQFKTHYLIESARPFEPSKHHRDRIRRGARRCRVERVVLRDHLETWEQLYAGLVDRRDIRGSADFTASYFEQLAQAPELVALMALVEDRPAAMTLWFQHASIVYNHLTASSAEGYANGANYALYGAAIEHFAGAAAMNLGGGAGFDDNPDDGLATFKRGFANGETKAHLCGAVLDQTRYAELTRGRPPTDFFPAYRG